MYDYTVNDIADAESKRELIDSSKITPFCGYTKYPFWLVDRGWFKAEQLEFMNSTIQTINGQQHTVYDVSDVMRTDNPDVGLVGGSYCPISIQIQNHGLYFKKQLCSNIL